MSKTVVGLYRNMETAQDVVGALVDNGFRREDISLVAQDPRGKTRMEKASETGADVTEGAVGGAGVGAVLGGAAGLLVGLGALAIPGIGPIIAAGPLATTLAGAGVGAVAGGIVGALVDLGVPEEDARAYTEGVRHGHVLVAVSAPDEHARHAADIMNRFSPIDVRRESANWPAVETTRTGQTDWQRPGEMPRTHVRTEDTYTTGYTADVPGFDRFEPEFRRDFQARYANSGYGYSHYRSAYLHGYTLHRESDCNGDCRWEDIEPDARADWERAHPDNAWEDFKDAVREGWNALTHR